MIHLDSGPTFDKKSASGSLEVCDVSYTNVHENWIHRERFLTTDEMIYLQRGELYLRINSTDYTLRRGCLCFLHRFSSLSGWKTSDMPCEFYTVAYQGQLLNVASEAYIPVQLPGSSIYVDETVKRLYTAFSNGDVSPNESNVLFLSLIYEAERYQSGEDQKTPLMEKTIRYINDNIHRLLTVEEASEALGYNRDYISRQFFACYGIPIKKYIDQKKLGVAKHLLISSKMSLEQIARAVGFDDAQQFYKFFRYHEKVSPNQFRRLNS